jgi:predicted dehydrogenase
MSESGTPRPAPAPPGTPTARGRSIRVGILGVAHYHGHFWAQAFNEAPEAELAGIWDDDPERGREAAERHHTRYHPELAGLLRDCDAVGVTAETARHPELVEAAARAGVHVLCEKPTATSLAGCDRIEQAVRDGGVTFLQNFPKRYDPAHRELVETVRRGDLGEVRLVRVRHGHYYGLDPAFRRQWYADPVLGGGGALLDEGVHAADLLRWMLGDPASVVATVSCATPDLAVEDNGVAVFTFAAGATAEVAASWTCIAAEASIEVFGTGGTAMLGGVDLASKEFVAGPHLRVFRQGDERGRWRTSPLVPYIVQGTTHFQGPRHFLATLREGRPPSPSLEDGRRALAMILAAYRSAERGAAVPVTLDPGAGIDALR